MRVLSYAEFKRRDRFVLAAALSFGLADILVPGIFTHLFDGVDNPSSGLQGLFSSITIILSTPCTCDLSPSSALLLYSSADLRETWNDADIDIGLFAVLAAGIVASLLNIILPREMEDMGGEDDSDSQVQALEEQRQSGSSEGKVEV